MRRKLRMFAGCLGILMVMSRDVEDGHGRLQVDPKKGMGNVSQTRKVATIGLWFGKDDDGSEEGSLTWIFVYFIVGRGGQEGKNPWKMCLQGTTPGS